MAAVSVIATTNAATGSGTASLGSLVNKFAVLVTQSQPGNGRLAVDFLISWDGQSFVQAQPAYIRDNVYYFDTPASNVEVSFSGNAFPNAITVTALALTD